MDSSVTKEEVVFVATIMPTRTDFRLGADESGGIAAANGDSVAGDGGADEVEKRPKHSSGQTFSR